MSMLTLCLPSPQDFIAREPGACADCVERDCPKLTSSPTPPATKATIVPTPFKMHVPALPAKTTSAPRVLLDPKTGRAFTLEAQKKAVEAVVDRAERLLRVAPGGARDGGRTMTEAEGWAIGLAVRPMLHQLHALTRAGGLLSRSGAGQGTLEAAHFASFVMEVLPKVGRVVKSTEQLAKLGSRPSAPVQAEFLGAHATARVQAAVLAEWRQRKKDKRVTKQDLRFIRKEEDQLSAELIAAHNELVAAHNEAPRNKTATGCACTGQRDELSRGASCKKWPRSNIEQATGRLVGPNEGEGLAAPWCHVAETCSAARASPLSGWLFYAKCTPSHPWGGQGVATAPAAMLRGGLPLNANQASSMACPSNLADCPVRSWCAECCSDFINATGLCHRCQHARCTVNVVSPFTKALKLTKATELKNQFAVRAKALKTALAARRKPITQPPSPLTPQQKLDAMPTAALAVAPTPVPTPMSIFALRRGGSRCLSKDFMLLGSPHAKWKRRHGSVGTAIRPQVAAQLLIHAMAKRCADECAKHAGCQFFTVGQVDIKHIVNGAAWTAGMCRQELTKSSTCPEGFEKDTVNFYELVRRPKTHSPTPSTPVPTPQPTMPKAGSCTESLLAWAHIHFKRRKAVPPPLTAEAARAAADQLDAGNKATYTKAAPSGFVFDAASASASAKISQPKDDDDDDHGST